MGLELALLLAVVACAGAGVVLYQRRQKHPAPPSPPARRPTLDTVEPGDVINLDGRPLLVEALLECREELTGRSTRWRWAFLEGELLLETAPAGNVLYDRTEVVHQGSEAFQRLVAEGGALKTFEEEVRTGAPAPSVTFREGNRYYKLRNTGTFAADPVGPAGQLEVWRDISTQPEQNVYFKMEASDGELVLGVWTTHIALLHGRPSATAATATVYAGPGSRE